MTTPIKTKVSHVATTVPTAGQLVESELAINTADQAIYTRNDANAIVKLSDQAQLDAATADITTIEGDITTLQGDVTLVEADVSTIQNDIVTINNNIGVNGRLFRYWRLVNATANTNTANVDTTAVGYVKLDEIELIVDNGAEYQAVQTYATLTATSQDSGNSPTVLNDGNVNPAIEGCSWDAATVADPSFYIQWDFGIGGERRLVGIRQYAASGTNSFMGTFGSFVIEASDDAIVWDRYFYVSHDYDTTTKRLPPVGSNEWTDYSYFRDSDVANGITTDGNVTKIEIVTTLPVTPDPYTLYFCTT